MGFFEYCLQVPAHRIGSMENGGPFTLLQLKVLQEAITLVIFIGFSLFYFKHEPLKWNHFVALGCILAGVYFAFLKTGE
ncbi:MAG: DMT family protein [Flavobacteriales bacterium]